MLGALIGAGLGLASSIAGGVANRKARRKQEQMIAQHQKENQGQLGRKTQILPRLNHSCSPFHF